MRLRKALILRLSRNARAKMKRTKTVMRITAPRCLRIVSRFTV
jgi:hypothetical protein